MVQRHHDAHLVQQRAHPCRVDAAQVESLDGDGAHSALALAETAREHFSEAAAAQQLVAQPQQRRGDQGNARRIESLGLQQQTTEPY